MVIQRWQSVWLLVSAICLAFFCFLPMAYLVFDGPAPEGFDSQTFIRPADNVVVMTTCLVTTLILILSIFSFKDTRRQKLMTILSVVLMAVIGCCGALMTFGTQTEGGRIEWMGSIFLLFGAILFALLAYRGIRGDEKLLRAADRLR